MKTGKESIWLLIGEYVLAAPILGAPCYFTVPVLADRLGIGIGAMIIVGVLFSGLAAYQLKRVITYGHSSWLNVYRLSGILCIVLALLVVLNFISFAPAVPANEQSFGTFSPATTRSLLMVFSSLAFGFLVGFATLLLGYVRLELVANSRRDSSSNS